jgi:hypothetical protein
MVQSNIGEDVELYVARMDDLKQVFQEFRASFQIPPTEILSPAHDDHQLYEQLKLIAGGFEGGEDESASTFQSVMDVEH